MSIRSSFASRNNTAHEYLLRALVSCGVCQYSCTARALNHKHYYYICSSKAKAVLSGRDEACPSRYIPAQQLDTVVWQDLCEVLTHPEQITHALERAHGGHWLSQELQARRENLRKGRAQLRQQLERLTEAYLQAIIPLPEYERRRRDIEQKEQALGAQEQQLLAQAERQHEIAGLGIAIEEFCHRVQDGLDNATFEQKRRLIELLIDRVIVKDEEVEIRYVIPTSPSSEHVRFCHLRTDYFASPNVIGRLGTHAAQQIGIDVVLRRALTQVRSRTDASDAHLTHVALDSLTIDRMEVVLQQHRQLAGAVKWMGGIQFVDPVLDCHFLRRWRQRLIVQRAAAD